MITRANMEVGVSRVINAHHSARGDVARPNTTSPACFSVRSVAGSACVCLRGIMVIRPCALATTTGRPRREDPSALKLQPHLNKHKCCFLIYLSLPSLFHLRHYLTSLLFTCPN